MPACLLLCSATPTPSAHTLRRPSTAAAAPLAHTRVASHSSSTTAAAVLALPPTVRLYQLVSPALAGRAAAFGSELSLPFNWRLLDPPVFDAPGLHSSAAVSSSSSQKQRQASKAALPASYAAGARSSVGKDQDAAAGCDQTAAAAGSHASKAVLQRVAASRASVSIAVVVVEGADLLQQLPHLAGWVRHVTAIGVLCALMCCC